MLALIGHLVFTPVRTCTVRTLCIHQLYRPLLDVQQPHTDGNIKTSFSEHCLWLWLSFRMKSNIQSCFTVYHTTFSITIQVYTITPYMATCMHVHCRSLCTCEQNRWNNDHVHMICLNGIVNNGKHIFVLKYTITRTH